MILIDISTFLARLHPLIVHLPIGFLLLAVIFQLFSTFKPYENLKPAVAVTLLLGFMAGVLACLFGYLLSLSGDYDPDTLQNHMFSGISLTVISGILFFSTTPKFSALYALPRKVFTVLLIGLFFLISYSGHLGGTLTHGSGYLNARVLTEQKRPKPARVELAYIFEDVVHPILENKCAQCHQDGKLKGSLSVENLQSLLKGGKSGAAVVPGKTAESELFQRISLNPEHEKFMPSDGKTPLTKIETEILVWWIDKALAVEEKQLNKLKGNEAIRPQIASYLRMESTDPLKGAAAIAQHINPDIPAKLNLALVENLRNKGLMVRVMLQKPVMLDITLPSGSGIKINTFKEDLVKVAKNIIWLNLSDNAITDKELDFLKLLVNLEKLRLEKNPLTGEVSNQLLSLKHLKAVNLNETSISNAGLNKLTLNPNIKNIYSWKTSAISN